MGNCCGSTTTSDDGIIEAKYISPEGERPSPVNSPQQPSYSEAVQGHMTPESVPDITLPADEEQLEHMADREGQSVNTGKETKVNCSQPSLDLLYGLTEFNIYLFYFEKIHFTNGYEE